MNTHRRREDEYETMNLNDETSPSGRGTEIEVRKKGAVSDKGKAVGTLLLGFRARRGPGDFVRSAIG